MTYLSFHCKQNTKPPIKVIFLPSERSGNMWTTQRLISFLPPMSLKERLEVTGSSWLFNILHEMRDKGHPPDFEDGEWQRNRKTGRHRSPLTLIKTNFLKLTGRVHQISRTMTHFFQLRAARLLIKPGNNTALGNESFLYLFQLQFYWKSQGTWIMWTFLYFPHTPTTVKRDPICFLREHWKKSFEAIQEDEKREEEKADFIEAYSLLEYKAYMYWNKGFTALYQSSGRTLRFVGYQWGRNPTAPSLKEKPVKPAASSHTEITSFLLPPLHQQSNHSRLSGNRRYSSHFDLERGSSHYSPIALMDDSWVR